MISSFKENTEYTYQLYLKLTDEAAEQGYVFEPNTRLAVDCEYVEYPHLSETSVAMQIATNLTMTPTKSVEPKEIPVVEINNATLTFKDGEWTRSDEWFNDADHHGNYKDITAFDKNKTYNYNLAIFLNSKRADEGWYFGPNTKLKINGKEVSFTYIYDLPDDIYEFGVTIGITMTPVSADTPTEHVHSFGTAYKSNASYHWHECECGQVADKAAHIWDGGKLTKSPTDTQTGVKTYTCKTCGYTKNVSVPAKGMDIANSAYRIKVSGVITKAYTGRAVTLTGLKVTRETVTLKNGTDYTVTYANNVNIGTAKVKITGKGKYRGSITKTFAIKVSKTTVYSVKQANTNVVYKYKGTNNASNGTGTATLMGTTKSKADKKYTSASLSGTVKIGGVSFKVTAVNDKAFTGYNYLNKVVIGGNIKKIGMGAFYGCKSLAAVSIGRDVSVISSKAFAYCPKLYNVTVGSKITSIGSSAFASIKSGVTFKVPKNKYTSYVRAIKKAGAPKTAKYSKY